MTAQMATVAALTQVWGLTGNPMWTGAIGLAHGIPLLAFGFVGGDLADRYDRRTIVLISTIGQALAAIGLTAQAALGNTSPLLVLALIATITAAEAIGSPARRTLPVKLLPRDLVAAGLALQNIAFHASMLIGPAIGGLLIAASLPAGYGAQVAIAPIALAAAWRLPSLAADRPTGTKVQPGGWLFPFRLPVLRGVLLTDLATTTLSMPIAIFPMINALRFDNDPRTLGLFFSAIALGGITAGLLSGTVTRLRRWGVVQLACAIIWSLALVGFGLSASAALALSFLVLAGAADTTGVIARSGLVQLVTPDGLRGRVSAVDHVIGAAGPEAGNMRGGVLAAVVGAPAAVVIGGLGAVIAAMLIGITHPQLRTYDKEKEPFEVIPS